MGYSLNFQTMILQYSCFDIRINLYTTLNFSYNPIHFIIHLLNSKFKILNHFNA